MRVAFREGAHSVDPFRPDVTAVHPAGKRHQHHTERGIVLFKRGQLLRPFHFRVENAKGHVADGGLATVMHALAQLLHPVREARGAQQIRVHGTEGDRQSSFKEFSGLCVDLRMAFQIGFV